MTAAFIGLAGTLTGGLIGWFASLGAVRQANKLSNQRASEALLKQQSTVRSLLTSEIDINLLMLRADREDIYNNPFDIGRYDYAAACPCPEWSTVVYQNSILLLVDTLTPREISTVQHLYCGLKTISLARHTLAESIQRAHFYQKQSSYQTYDAISESIDATGNPLMQRGPSSGATVPLLQ